MIKVAYSCRLALQRRQLLPLARPDVASYSLEIARGETPQDVRDQVNRQDWDRNIRAIADGIPPFTVHKPQPTPRPEKALSEAQERHLMRKKIEGQGEVPDEAGTPPVESWGGWGRTT